MSKIVFAADLHLFPYAWASMPQVSDDSYSSYLQIIQYCVANKVDALLLGGDVFDANPTPDAVRIFLAGIAALRVARIPVGAIQGQHGRNRQLSWTSITDDVLDLDKSVLTVGSYVIGGIDNSPTETLKERLAAVPKEVNTLVLHQLCRYAVGSSDEDEKQIWNLDPAWVPNHVRLVLMGDYHKPWDWDRILPSGHKQQFFYTGSTCMQDIGEITQKSFLVFDDKGFVRQLLETRPFYHYMIRSEADLMEVRVMLNKLQVPKVKNAPDTPLVLVRFDPHVSGVESTLIEDNEKRIKEKTGSGVIFMFRPTTTESIEHPELTAPTSISLESCLSKVVDPQKDADVYNLTLDLLKAKDVSDTLAIHRARIIPANKP